MNVDSNTRRNRMGDLGGQKSDGTGDSEVREMESWLCLEVCDEIRDGNWGV